MDYKEKYEQALDNIKKIKAANKDNKELVDFIEYEYPELKESEDERIRKALMQHIKDNVSVISGWRKEELIAWLEKQKDRDVELERAYKCADAVQYRKGFEDGVASVKMNEDDENVRIKLIKALKECGFTHFNEEFKVQEAVEWLEKQGRPEPANK